jgi:hypothetical protein
VSTPELRGRTGQYFEAKLTPSRLSARELDPDQQQRAWELAAALVAAAPTSIRMPDRP